MQIVIDIAQNEYDALEKLDAKYLLHIIKDGTPLPKGHGRIGDLDVFESHVEAEWMNNEISNGDWIQFRELLKRVPTLVDADKGGKRNAEN